MKGNDPYMEINDDVLMAFIAGELSREDRSRVFAWIERDETNKAQFDALAQTWELSSPKASVKVDVNQAWAKVLTRVSAENETPIIPLKQRTRRIWYVAASILILIGAFSLVRFFNSPLEQVSVLAENRGLVDELEDGSVVTLNANTRIDYPSIFADDERRIALSGEAFFEVARDESKPFIIDLPDQTHVKVLGTSFNINAYESKTISSVFVATGRVEFGTDEQMLELIPGETGYYNASTGELWKENNSKEKDQILFWKNGKIKFDDASLEEVVSVMNAIYDQEIVLNCDSAKKLATHETIKRDNSLIFILNVLASTHHLKIDSIANNSKIIYSLECDD